MDPYAIIKLYKDLVKEIRDACDDERETIDELVSIVEAKIEEPPIYKCNKCCDTGYEDAQGYCRCRHRCPVR